MWKKQGDLLRSCRAARPGLHERRIPTEDFRQGGPPPVGQIAGSICRSRVQLCGEVARRNLVSQPERSVGAVEDNALRVRPSRIHLDQTGCAAPGPNAKG